MALRQSRNARKFQIESLERREVLSTVHLAPAIIHEARRPNPRPSDRFAGSARGSVTGFNVLSDGRVEVTSNLNGSANRIGPFSVSFHTIESPSSSNLTGDATLIGANGDQVKLSLFNGTIQGLNRPTSRINGRFAIVGGTGAFAHATGSGSLSGNVNNRNLGITLNFNGTIHLS